jgi:hypothetical protein
LYWIRYRASVPLPKFQRKAARYNVFLADFRKSKNSCSLSFKPVTKKSKGGNMFRKAFHVRFFNTVPIAVQLTVMLWFAVSVSVLATVAQASPTILRELPVTLQGTVSDALGLDDPAYYVEQVSTSCRGGNPAQQFDAVWSEGGLAIQTGKLNWGLRLDDWGYGEELVSAGPSVPQANAHRVEYRRSGLTEWYVNGPLGIEQGFTVSSPPNVSSPGEALTLRLAWSGEVNVQVEKSAAVVSNTAGEPALRYGGLIAYDAAGRSLHAWLEQSGAAILLRVDDREATYPVVIDPFIQQQKLTASDGATDDEFGYSVSLSSDGNTALIGAESAAVGGNSRQGAAYVFVRSGGVWSQQQKLTASDGTSYDYFGNSVSISADGSTALSGAHFADVGVQGYSGAAYVFVRSGGVWSQQQKLTASDVDGYSFGDSVSLSGDGSTAVIGASYALIGGNIYQGAAYVFVRNGGTWSPQEKLIASVGASYDYFGNSVSMSADGSTALIGAGNATIGSNTDQGAAYVFVRSGETWSQQQQLVASDGGVMDQFGSSVSLNSNGSVALIGAYGASIDGNASQGAAYVFAVSGGVWSQQQKLTASDGATGDWFGWSVSLSGDGSTALIGAFKAAIGGNYLRGAAYVFVGSGGVWSQQQKLIASDGVGGDAFGYSVTINGDGKTALIGADWAKIGYHDIQGAAYAFTTESSAETSLAAGFIGSGLWVYKTGSATWAQVSAINPDNMIYSGSTLYGDFGTSGLWKWSGTAWSQLTGANPENMAISGSELYGDFGTSGLWKWSGTAWSQLTGANPENMAISGTELYGDFGTSGLWKWNGTAWNQLTGGNPENMAISGSVFYGDFGTSGLWKWSGTAWSQLTGANPENMVVSETTLYVDFGALGLYQWNGTAWSQLTGGNPENMAVSGSVLYGDFGTSGLWKWSGTAWSQLTGADPENMVVAGSSLYVDFGVSGLWKWDGSSWFQLTGSNPAIMAASN